MFTSLENKHGLIIEDSATDANVLKSLLQRLGINASVVFDTRKLPDVLDTLPRVDIIFLDLEMPLSSGYEVLGTLRAHPITQRAPIVAYTSHMSEARTARDAGFHSYLVKPLKLDKFTEQLMTIFSGESVWDTR